MSNGNMTQPPDVNPNIPLRRFAAVVLLENKVGVNIEGRALNLTAFLCTLTQFVAEGLWLRGIKSRVMQIQVTDVTDNLITTVENQPMVFPRG